MQSKSRKIWILGPCSIESEELFYECMVHINSIMTADDDWYMKASFDKANRTSIEGKRGPGLNESIKIWTNAKKDFPNIKFTTDVHECWQVELLQPCIDVIQIPAFLSRQTDLIVESARAFNKMNIKKGQWIGPYNARKSVDKVKTTNQNCEVWICDRGSNFGYHDLFVNFGIVDELKRYYDKVIIDCTHSTQRSREVYGVQGDPILAGRYLVAADLFNYDGIFAETHPRPEESVSDGQCLIPMSELQSLISKAKKVGKINRD